LDPLSDTKREQLSGKILLGIALLVVAYGIKVYFKEGDLTVFTRGAENLLSGTRIYLNEPRAFTYPPFFAFLMIPFTWFEIHIARLIWYALSVMFFILSLRAAGTIAAPELDPLTARPGIRLSSRTVSVLAVLFTLRFVLSAIDNQQSDLMLLAFSLMGLAALVERKQFLCGVFLAAAVSIKLTPLLFVPYLLFRRAYASMFYFLICSVVFWAIPELLFPADSGVPLVSSWYDLVITKVSPWEGGTPWTDGGGIWTAASVLNQSLPATIYRYLVDTVIQIHGGRIQVNIFDMDPRTVKTVCYTLMIVLLAVSGSVMWKSRNDRRGPAFDSGIVFCLMLLLSPQSSKPHFSALFLPHLLLFAVLAKQKLAKRTNFTLIVALCVSFFLDTLSAEGFVGRRFSDVLEAHGVITVGTLLIWSMLLCCRTGEGAEDTLATGR